MKLDRDEISELWDKITPKLYGYLVNSLKDKGVADDILQNTWFKAIEALPRFEDRGLGINAWIFSIARNEMRMYWRTSGRNVSLDEDLHDVPVDYKNDIENKLFLDQILTSLSSGEQELIRLRYIADLSMAEIAKLLNKSPIAIRVSLHRALSRARMVVSKK